MSTSYYPSWIYYIITVAIFIFSASKRRINQAFLAFYRLGALLICNINLKIIWVIPPLPQKDQQWKTLWLRWRWLRSGWLDSQQNQWRRARSIWRWLKTHWRKTTSREPSCTCRVPPASELSVILMWLSDEYPEDGTQDVIYSGQHEDYAQQPGDNGQFR